MTYNQDPTYNHNLYRRRPLQALNDLLQNPAAKHRVSRGAPALCRDMGSRASEAMLRLRTAERDRMLRSPWRVVRVVFPDRQAIWPVENMTPRQTLAECRRLIALEQARATHWTHDFRRLVALQHAEAALVIMVSDTDQAEQLA
ncbi:MAG: hypothetical protein ACTSU0_08065 [Alphaproteobacteria bacterium]